MQSIGPGGVQFTDEDKAEHLHIKVLLDTLVALYDLAGQPGLFMTEAESTKVKGKVNTLLAQYNWLGRTAEDKKVKR